MASTAQMTTAPQDTSVQHGDKSTYAQTTPHTGTKSRCSGSCPLKPETRGEDLTLVCLHRRQGTVHFPTGLSRVIAFLKVLSGFAACDDKEIVDFSALKVIDILLFFGGTGV